MNAMKLTAVGLLASAIIFGGCSKNSSVTGPENQANVTEFTSQSGTTTNAARLAVHGDDQRTENLSIVAKVLRTEVEGGCFYLATEKGETYTPIVPKSLTLEEGMRLKASGYVDKNIQFFCGNGPAFVIQQYEIVDQSKLPQEDRFSEAKSDDAVSQKAAAALELRASEEEHDKIEKKEMPISDTPSEQADKNQDKTEIDENPISDIPAEPGGEKFSKPEKNDFARMKISRPVPIIFDDMQLSWTSEANVHEGYIRFTKDGCLLLETSDKKEFELQHDMDILLESGDYIRVTGYISTLPYMSCSNAPVFEAESISILSHAKKQNMPKKADIAPVSDEALSSAVEVEGTMHPTEPEGMCWYLEADNGDRYELISSNPISVRPGQRLKVKGKYLKVSTFCAAGTPLEVLRMETVNENKF